MSLPTFLIVGAPRAGTTSLYHALRQHPAVFMSPVKEPLFFAVEGEAEPFRGPRDAQGIRDIEEYAALFEAAGGERARGEVSTLYLQSPEAPARIRRRVPEAKIVAVLRDPAERAYSNYLLHRREGREEAGFWEAIAAEEERARLGWSPAWRYRGLGLYGEQLRRYFDVFSPEQIHIILFEDLDSNALEVSRELFRFLGVDDSFEPDVSMRYNVGGIPRSRALHRLLTSTGVLKRGGRRLLARRFATRLALGLSDRNLDRPTLSGELHERLIGEYRSDIRSCEELIGRDLSRWLDGARA